MESWSERRRNSPRFATAIGLSSVVGLACVVSMGVSACAASQTGAPADAAEIGEPLTVVPDSEKWRATPPAAPNVEAPPPPKLDVEVLENGLTLITAEDKRWPFVQLTLASRGGAAMDPPGQSGLTAMTFALIGDGDVKVEGGFMKSIGELGASYGTSVANDSAVVTLAGKSKDRSRLFELLAACTTKPEFRSRGLEWRRAWAEERREIGASSPGAVAWEHLPERLFGSSHPYGHPASGSLRSIIRLEITDVKRHFPDVFDPHRSALIVAGAVTPKEARTLAKKHLTAWTGTKASKRRAIPPVPERKRAFVKIVHRENLAQAKVYIGRALVGAEHEDRVPLIVTSEILGGSISARLPMALRETRGFTYSTTSVVDLRPGAGAFVAEASISLEQLQDGLAAFLKTLDDLKTRPPTDAEVTSAVSAYQSRTSFDSLSDVTRAAVFAFKNGFPIETASVLADEIAAVTPDAVRRAAQKYFDPATMAILIVGDARHIKKAIAPLNLGRIVVVRG